MERGPHNHYIGGWIGPSVSLDVVEKEKNTPSLLSLGTEPSSACNLVTI